MEGIELAIRRAVVAGKLRAAARDFDDGTADALERAADRYSRGAALALEVISDDRDRREAWSRPSSTHPWAGGAHFQGR